MLFGSDFIARRLWEYMGHEKKIGLCFMAVYVVISAWEG